MLEAKNNENKNERFVRMARLSEWCSNLGMSPLEFLHVLLLIAFVVYPFDAESIYVGTRV